MVDQETREFFATLRKRGVTFQISGEKLLVGNSMSLMTLEERERAQPLKPLFIEIMREDEVAPTVAPAPQTIATYKPNETERRVVARSMTDSIKRHIEAGEREYKQAYALLLEMHENKSFKELGHKTFEDYCQKEFGFTRQRGYQLIEAAKLAKVSTLVDKIPETHAREMKDVPAEKAAQTYERAKEIAAQKPEPKGMAAKFAPRNEDGKPVAKVTAQDVKQAVAETLGLTTSSHGASRKANSGASGRTRQNDEQKDDAAEEAAAVIVPLSEQFPNLYAKQVSWNQERGIEVLVPVNGQIHYLRLSENVLESSGVPICKKEDWNEAPKDMV